ncbi:ATP-binding protein [Candidatus Symbiothrix dinenymphae]|uniref:ATP-binding protein n=1 Tax=Candidatus Symbiothrix dinenymphae TaxID=467085 RepID=UPI0006C1F714|nr:4Fe-4S dicluster domain-containing protein [Candidatus Symbiothrix dinenymphae]GAP72909.1 hypothetical protein SAMD00024442_5_26 [Candidatus Symbiothrix dinenymphae]
MNTVYIVVGSVFLLWFVHGLCRHARGRNRVIHVIDGNCTGCGRCVKRCQHHVLELVKDENGTHAVVKQPDRCSACGDCLPKCKFSALNFANTLLS